FRATQRGCEQCQYGLKRQAYGITQYKTGDYQVDHLIPLSLDALIPFVTFGPIDKNIALELLCESTIKSPKAPRNCLRKPKILSLTSSASLSRTTSILASAPTTPHSGS